MKFRVVLTALALLSTVVSAAHSDMVELRGEGYLNGEILSEDENMVQFRDSYGNVRSLNKGDILYKEKEKKSLNSILLPKSMNGWVEKAKAYFSGNKSIFQGFLLPKPSESKAAIKETAKMKQTSSMLDEANKAASAASRARKEQMRREKEMQGNLSQSSGEEKVNFRSL
jgi:hypothetical protein